MSLMARIQLVAIHMPMLAGTGNRRRHASFGRATRPGHVAVGEIRQLLCQVLIRHGSVVGMRPRSSVLRHLAVVVVVARAPARCCVFPTVSEQEEYTNHHGKEARHRPDYYAGNDATGQTCCHHVGGLEAVHGMGIRLGGRRGSHKLGRGGYVGGAILCDSFRLTEGEITVAGTAIGRPAGIDCRRWWRELIASV